MTNIIHVHRHHVPIRLTLATGRRIRHTTSSTGSHIMFGRHHRPTMLDIPFLEWIDTCRRVSGGDGGWDIIRHHFEYIG